MDKVSSDKDSNQLKSACCDFLLYLKNSIEERSQTGGTENTLLNGAEKCSYTGDAGGSPILSGLSGICEGELVS